MPSGIFISISNLKPVTLPFYPAMPMSNELPQYLLNVNWGEEVDLVEAGHVSDLLSSGSPPPSLKSGSASKLRDESELSVLAPPLDIAQPPFCKPVLC